MKTSRKKNTKSLTLRQRLSTKRGVILAVSAIFICLLLGTWCVLAVRDTKPETASPVTPSTPSPSVANDKQPTESNKPPNATNPIPPGEPAATEKPFTVSKVYFATAPSAPSDASFGKCSLGQIVNYQVSAQVTAASKGAVQFHWEIADHLGGTVDKQSSQQLDFSAAGTKIASTTLSYTVRDTGNGTNLNNRQYVNLVTTSPNATYANIEKPVYAYKNGAESFFIWGTYIDLC